MLFYTAFFEIPEPTLNVWFFLTDLRLDTQTIQFDIMKVYSGHYPSETLAAFHSIH